MSAKLKQVKKKCKGVVDSLHQSGAGVDSVDELRKAFFYVNFKFF